MDRTNVTIFRMTPAELKRLLNFKEDSILISVALQNTGSKDNQVVFIFNEIVVK